MLNQLPSRTEGLSLSSYTKEIEQQLTSILFCDSLFRLESGTGSVAPDLEMSSLTS